MTSEEHTGAAWLLRDITHVPGLLRLVGGRLEFTSTRRVVFDATPAELELTVSRTRRDRFHLVVGGERLGLSLVRPPGAVAVPDDLWARVTGRPVPPEQATPDAVRRRLAAIGANAVAVRPASRRRGARRPGAPVPREHGRRGFAQLAGLVRSSPPDPA